jgi:hypothetical protein
MTKTAKTPPPDVALPEGVPYLPWFSELALTDNFPPGWLPFEGKVPIAVPVLDMRRNDRTGHYL